MSPTTGFRQLLSWLALIACAAPTGAQPSELPYIFSTFAGLGGSSGHVDGTGTEARFARPWGLSIDPQGNLYVTEIANHTVRKVTPAGVVTTVAGRPGFGGWLDGPSTTALLGGSALTPPGVPVSSVAPTGPFGITRDSAGNLFIADSIFQIIRKVTPANVVSTLAGTPQIGGHLDGPAASTQFKTPFGVTALADGSVLVADTFNHVIRKISPTGIVTTIAGVPGVPGSLDGTSAQALFLHPCAVLVGPNKILYVTDANNLVRRLTPADTGATGYTVATIAGSALLGGSVDGQGSVARLGAAAETLQGVTYPYTQGLSGFGGPSGGDINLYAVGGLTGLALAPDGNLIVADYYNHTIRQVTPTGLVTTLAGKRATRGRVDGAGTSATFSSPAGVVIDSAGNLYIADSLNNTIRKGTRAAAPAMQTPTRFVNVAVGATSVVTASVTGFPAPSYQWFRDGTSINGATAATLIVPNLSTTHTGTYTLTATNDYGAAVSPPILVNVVAPLVITKQPESRSFGSTESVILTVEANASIDTSYQWYRNGVPILDGISAGIVLLNDQPNRAGTYTVTLTNIAGTVTSSPAVLTLATSKIVNLSVRSFLAANQTLTVGFVVSGVSKPLLIRAIGPSLRQFGLTAAMPDSVLTLFTAQGPAGTNDNWGDTSLAPQIATVSKNVGAFDLPSGSLDAALLTTAGNSALTVQAVEKKSAGGIVLLELYDTAPNTDARFINVSTRAPVGRDDAALVAGFVIAGTVPQKILLRAIGPTLAGFGVSGTLADPKLEVFADGSTTPLATNDNWNGDPTLVNSFVSVGAFPLPSANSRDAVLLLSLPPGNYSAKVTGVGGTTGEALLELYQHP